ncbi:MAG: zf-HC2 domain-containing protein [Thermoanaerobaculia bacterium]
METPEERAWREAYQSGMQTGSGACPGNETLAALVLGELSGNERAALVRHVSECRRCAEGYRTLLALHAEAGSMLPRRRMRWPAVAAAAVLAVGLGVTLVWLARTGGPGAVDDAVRGGSVDEKAVDPADGAVLPSPPVALSWPADADATGYRVRLYDSAAEPLWESHPIASSEIELPPSVREDLIAGQAYFWVVEVAGSSTGRRQGPYWFELSEPE